jgi:hypothetical protein
MSMPDLLTIWSDDPGISLIVWFFLVVFGMYLGRTPAHQLVLHAARTIRSAMRLTAISIAKMEDRLNKRNKEVILSTGMEATERSIEREFHRINTAVANDLSGYPSVYRQLNDVIQQIEEDYRNSTETPPAPPAWLDAVEAITRIPRNGDSTIDKLLGGIQQSMERAHKETLTEYRKNNLDRLQMLKRMLPSWRDLSKSLNTVKGTVDDLRDRSSAIDKQMQTYEEIRNAEDRAARVLTSSSLTQFFISSLVLTIAIMGGVINFQLIALPMSEMVGGTSHLGSMRTADVAALVIIAVEVAMGLFLLESLRITHLFPIIGSMDDKMRRRMLVITLSILTILATVEASLAYMRDILAMDREALTQSLSGIGVADSQFRWIPSMGQMVMGFILPFTLAFVAIPLESFVHSSRTVMGLLATGILRALIFAARLIGNNAYQLGRVLVGIYDLVIFLPLKVEELILGRKDRALPIVDEIETVETTEGVYKR